jgi:hypothetical protein
MQSGDQLVILQGMEPSGRWRVAAALYAEARAWKASALRALHPDWSEDQVEQTVRKAFLHGHTA